MSEELMVVNDHNPETATRAVLALLNQKVTEGEVEDVQHMLPSSIRALWPDE